MKTRNYFLNLLLVTALAFSVASCDNNEEVQPQEEQPEEENPIEEQPEEELPAPDGVALLEMFNQNLEEIRQEFELTAEDGGTITGEEGTMIQFGPNAFLTEAGDSVSGPVTIELVEIYSKAKMVLTEMATKGRNQEGEIATLISGGEFFINATQGDVQLKPAYGFTLMVPVDNTGGADEEMGIFAGVQECDDDDCDIIWEEEDKDLQIGQREGGAPGGTGVETVYYAFQSQFGWTNIDKWYSDPRPKTTIFADVPEGYDDTNCAVYISYDGEPTALAQFDVYNTETGLFTEHYGLIPIGLEVHFIMVSIVDGQYNYAIQAATITENHIEVIGDLQPTTEEALVQLIEDLP